MTQDTAPTATAARPHHGRKPGVPNRTTAQVREILHALLDENIDRMRDDLNKMAPATRVKLLLELAKFVVPTLKAIDITSDGDPLALRNIHPITIVLSQTEGGDDGA